ncbi:MAG: HEAT repeat domain-containing protein [Pirellulales bacterium]|nr:HEAT repeat domain-containing protein [Pirellulales bacterium]
MSSHRKTWTIFLFVVGGLYLAGYAIASPPAEATPVEHESQWWPKGQGNVLGTIHYRPSQEEEPFFKRLATDEIVTGSMSEGYDISTRDKKYVGWFGIVRGIREDKAGNHTVLTVEHKYFDGLTDAHMQAVSFNGSGDFQAVLRGTGLRVPPLSLVKIYGTVSQGKKGAPPRIDAVFVRDWHWGTFVFMGAYGVQRGSAKWRKANQVPLDDLYEAWPHPCHHYYEKRLGKRPDGPAIRKELLDAAGPLPPEARQAMERLADLLALGHCWSKAESFRQAEEFSQIDALVKKTNSHRAATRLLLQALRANDERVSWSATEKFVSLDPKGEAVPDLVKLLDDSNARVRAGAALAFRYGYGAKSAPAVAGLTRCITDKDPELHLYAIRALADMGPSAKAAAPVLKSVLAGKDRDLHMDAARAVWRITGQSDDVLRMCIADLEKSDKRYSAADQLKELGPRAAPAVPALTKALNDEDWCTRCNVAEALGEMGPKAATAIPALMKVLRSDEDSLVRARAAEALGNIGDARSVPALLAAIKDEDSFVRAQVVEALGTLGDEKVVPSLITALEDENDYVVMCAISALESYGHKAKTAVPALIRTVKSDKRNGSFAARALGKIDAEGASVPALIEVLGSSDPTSRRLVADGLLLFGRKAAAAEKVLHDGLKDEDTGARIAAAGAYWAVSGKAEEPVRVLRAAVAAPDDSNVLRWATEALAEIGPEAKAAVPELSAWLKSDDWRAVTESATALGKIGPGAASAVPALEDALKRADYDYTRVWIARALWCINRSEKSLPVLEDVLKNTQDTFVLWEAIEAIGDRGPEAKALIPLLRPLLEAGDSHVRKVAAKALKQIEAK